MEQDNVKMRDQPATDSFFSLSSQATDLISSGLFKQRKTDLGDADNGKKMKLENSDEIQFVTVLFDHFDSSIDWLIYLSFHLLADILLCASFQIQFPVPTFWMLPVYSFIVLSTVNPGGKLIFGLVEWH